MEEFFRLNKQKIFVYLLILLPFLMGGCSSTSIDGPGRYELKVNNMIVVDESFSLQYSKYDKLGGTLTWFKGQNPIQSFQSCIPRGPDVIDFSKLTPYFFYSLNPDQDEKCNVEIFREKEFLNNELELGNYEGFPCGRSFIGVIIKTGGINPYELHNFDTITAQRQASFAMKDQKIALCGDFKVKTKNIDKDNKKILIVKE